MKPDFFDEIANKKIANEEIDIFSSKIIGGTGRYIYVFELFNDDEIAECNKCKVYNDKVEYVANKGYYSIFNTLIACRCEKQKYVKSYHHVIMNVLKQYYPNERVNDKRFYILDIKDNLRLVYALNISKKEYEKELNEVLSEIEINPEEKDFIDEEKIVNRIKEQVYKEKSTITVQNINSTIPDIPQEAKELVNQVAADDELINSSWDITIRLNDQNSFYRWFNFLLSQITVYLVREEEMPTMIEYFKSKDLSDDEIPQATISKALGCYYPMSRIIENKKIQIIICPELIEQTAKSMGIDKNVAYAKVIIHEFAHAVMDERNIISREKYNEDVIKLDKGPGNKINFHNPLFEFVMEESIANYLTLLKFQTSTSSIQKDVYRFIDNQPEAYRFGIKQFDAHVKACKWRTMKDIITPEKAQEWLDKYFINNEPYSFEAFDNLFK